MDRLEECIKQGRGETLADKVLTGGRIFDLITGDLLKVMWLFVGRQLLG